MKALRSILFALTPLLSATAAICADSAGRLADALRNADGGGTPFDLVATVSYVSTNRVNEQTNVAVVDETGRILFRAEDRSGLAAVPRPGAKARCRGFVERRDRNRKFAVLTNYVELSFGPAPAPVALSRGELLADANAFRLCRFTGTLRDVATNETDPGWLLLTVCDADGMVYATVPLSSDGDQNFLEKRIGARATITGVCVPYDHSTRFRTGRVFKIPSFDRIEIGPDAEVADGTPPAVEDIPILEPADFASLGRHRATGRVIAATKPDRAILRNAAGNLIGVEFNRPDALPRYGDLIEAVGLPETDTFQLILYRAAWKRIDAPPMEDERPQPVSPRLLTHEANGRPRTTSAYHGHAIAVRGVVSGLSEQDGLMTVDCDDTQVTVDASATPSALAAVAPGCRVSVAGTCVIYVEAPRINTAVPRIRGFSVVVRAPGDVAVLSRPSPWTPQRLTVVIGALFVAICAILVWNTMLRRVAERRAGELADETIARAAADLKVYERTRLAVELHDSIAQNLTGVSLEIDTAERLSRTDPGKMREHLGIASRALKSCRDELRNCLWDLRHQTLESADMEAAIRQTLGPHVAGAALSVRFKVPRERISDNTAHAILRIVRELTVNAIRHGKATEIRVAGSVEGGKLLFSVRDNGCGFDPANCPGDEQGHYGLLGIRERINGFEGMMNVDSALGKGTKVTVYLNIPQESKGRT